MTSQDRALREITFYLAFKRYIWPIQRRFLKSRLRRRCRRCNLPESFTALTTESCANCEMGVPSQRVSLAGTKEQQNKLDSVIHNAIRVSRSHYHAVVLFSGGKDSCYLLHRLSRDYPDLKVMALTIDNTFMSDVAMSNIASVIHKTGTAHTVIRPPAEMMERIFRHALLHLNEKGCSGTVDQIDGDVFIDIGRNFASRMGIPLVLVGLSPVQTEQILSNFDVVLSGKLDQEDRQQIAGIAVNALFTDTEANQFLWRPSQLAADQKPALIFPFYAWNVSEPDIKAEVSRLGLVDERFQHPMLTNSTLIPLMGLVDLAKLGYSSFEPEFSRMVREGRVERKDWRYTFEMLEYAALTGAFLGSSVDAALERLRLTRKEVGIE